MTPSRPFVRDSKDLRKARSRLGRLAFLIEPSITKGGRSCYERELRRDRRVGSGEGVMAA